MQTLPIVGMQIYQSLRCKRLRKLRVYLMYSTKLLIANKIKNQI